MAASPDEVSAPHRLFLFGSCVSRDTVEYLGSPVSLVRYVARQSLISAGTSALAASATLPRFESPFQERTARDDLVGNVYRRLRASAPSVDLLVVDLVDERGGVYPLADGYATRSVERVAAGTDAVLGDPVPFGTAEHLALWRAGFARFVAEVTAAGLWTRTVLLAVPWAERTAAGVACPSSFGFTPAAGNEAFGPYYAAAEESGLATIAPRPGVAVEADPGHRWGIAPFHYTDAVYADLASQLDGVMGGMAPRDAGACRTARQGR